ncbi:hypothetical protein diail_200 [Diaporthe ilicicola]|nr:hypothetical protein diail_200 [Diaporthe ilicicola]
MLVELKNGETLNGHLVNCDTWMNLTLKEVVQTSPVRPRRGANTPSRSTEGDRFTRLPEAYVKGNNVGPSSKQSCLRSREVGRGTDKSRTAQIKYLRVPDEIVDIVKEQQANHQGGFRGGRGGQNRGDHGGRGGDRGGRGRGQGRGRGRGRG